MREVLQPLSAYSRGCRRVSLIAREDFGGQAATLGKDGVEEMHGLEFGFGGNRRFGERDHAADARRDEDAVPQPILARTERPPHVDQHVVRLRAARGEARFDRRIAFFDEREQQMTDADVIVVVIPARLLGRA